MTGEDRIKLSGRIFLNQILVFPMAVVLLASVALLCGGRCALWQWWGAVAVVLAFPFLKKNWRESSFAGLWFLIFLYVLWVVSGISVTREWWDSHTYHFPVVRMLMLGWNPVWDYSCEAIHDACGGEISLWAVFSMPRPVWYFSAVASFFTQNQFDFYHPIVILFFCSGIGFLLRAFKKANSLVRFVIAVLVIAHTQIYEQAPDMVVALSALGLLAVQYAYIKGAAWQTLPMVCFSFWMCSAKQTGIAFCAVDWISFALVVLIKDRKAWQERVMSILKTGGIVAALFIFANVSPYFTSWIHYSHPLYPQFTFDEHNHPRHNFTADFLALNDDAKAMSNRMAMFCNAYVSPELVRDYYSWKLGRPSFRPWGGTWKQGGGKDGWDTQLKAETRYWIMIPIVLMLILGGLAERFVSAVLVLCTMALPVEMIGLLRYVTIVQFSIVFFIPLLWDLAEKRLVARLVCGGCLLCLGYGKLCNIVTQEVKFIDGRLSIYESFEKGLPEILYYNKFARDHHVSASLNLMQRLVPQMRRVRFATIPESLYHGKDVKKNLDSEFPASPDLSFRFPNWYNPQTFSNAQAVRARESKPKIGSKWAWSLFEYRVFWKSFMADVPRAMWLRITGKMDNHMKNDKKDLVKAPEAVYAKLASAFLDRWSFYVTYDHNAEPKEKVTVIP